MLKLVTVCAMQLLLCMFRYVLCISLCLYRYMNLCMYNLLRHDMECYCVFNEQVELID